MFEYPVEVLRKKAEDVEKAKNDIRCFSLKSEAALRKSSIEYMELETKLMDLNYAIQMLEELGKEPTDDEIIEGVGYDGGS